MGDHMLQGAKARIYKPVKSAMQSGRGNTKKWVLEFAPCSPCKAEDMMGWISSADTKRQITCLKFDTLEEAEAYAKSKDLDYCVEQPKHRTIKPKSYAANFQ